MSDEKEKQEKIGGKCFICKKPALLEAVDEDKFICDDCYEIVIVKKAVVTQEDHKKALDLAEERHEEHVKLIESMAFREISLRKKEIATLKADRQMNYVEVAKSDMLIRATKEQERQAIRKKLEEIKRELCFESEYEKNCNCVACRVINTKFAEYLKEAEKHG